MTEQERQVFTDLLQLRSEIDVAPLGDDLLVFHKSHGSFFVIRAHTTFEQAVAQLARW